MERQGMADMNGESASEWETFPDDALHFPSIQKFMAASHNRKMIIKLRSLQRLARFGGFYPKDEHEALENFNKTPLAWIICALHRVMNQTGTPIERAYCSAFLDFMSVSWRQDLVEMLPGSAFHRDDPVVLDWRKAVLKRDGRTCQSCGSKKQLHAHHIVHWAACVDLRAVVDNGITLCKTCHVQTHRDNGTCGPIKRVA